VRSAAAITLSNLLPTAVTTTVFPAVAASLMPRLFRLTALTRLASFTVTLTVKVVPLSYVVTKDSLVIASGLATATVKSVELVPI